MGAETASLISSFGFIELYIQKISFCPIVNYLIIIREPSDKCVYICICIIREKKSLGIQVKQNMLTKLCGINRSKSHV